MAQRPEESPYPHYLSEADPENGVLQESSTFRFYRHRFTWCNHTEGETETTWGPDGSEFPAHDIEFREVFLRTDSFCSDCWIDPFITDRLARNIEISQPSNNHIGRRVIAKILDRLERGEHREVNSLLFPWEHGWNLEGAREEDGVWLSFVLLHMRYEFLTAIRDYPWQPPTAFQRRAVVELQLALTRLRISANELVYHNPVATRFDMLLTRISPSVDQPQECTICTSESDVADAEGDGRVEFAVKLPCGHIFGDLCIRTWINEKRKPTCPICRRKLESLEELLARRPPRSVKEEVRNEPWWLAIMRGEGGRAD